MSNYTKTKARGSLSKKFHLLINCWYAKVDGDLERELNLLPDFFNGGGRFFDVGANRGVYVYATAKMCKHSALFEPNSCYAIVLRWFAQSQTNIWVQNLGLSDHQASAILQIPVDNTGVEQDSAAALGGISAKCFRDHCVQLEMLHSFNFDDKLIKVDVEGRESRMVYVA